MLAAEFHTMAPMGALCNWACPRFILSLKIIIFFFLLLLFHIRSSSLLTGLYGWFFNACTTDNFSVPCIPHVYMLTSPQLTPVCAAPRLWPLPAPCTARAACVASTRLFPSAASDLV